MDIKKEILMSLLGKISPNTLSLEEKTTLNELKDLAEEGENTLTLLDLSPYKSYTLWPGKEDVYFLILETGMYESLSSLDESTLEEFVCTVCDRINWEKLNDNAIVAGNEMIMQEIESVAKEREIKI